MRAFGIASVVTLALSVFAGCAIDGSLPEQTADEATGVAQQAVSIPWPGLNIAFGIPGYAGGCFKGPGICSIAFSSPWSANATGSYRGDGILTLKLDAAETPAEVRAKGGLEIASAIAIDTELAARLKAPKGLAIQPGFYAVRSDDSKTALIVDVKVAPAKGDEAPVESASTFANPANPFDWVGKVHNRGMVYGRSVLPVGASPEMVDDVTTKFLAGEGITFDAKKFFSSGVSKFAAELFVAPSPGDYLVKSGKISARGAGYFVKILDASTKNALSGDYRQNKLVEVEIMTDKDLPAQESDVLLATSAIGRYSAAYVISTGILTGPEPANAPPIVKADISGAVSGGIGGAVAGGGVGSIPGWVVGTVVGGVGNSLGEWVSSWW